LLRSIAFGFFMLAVDLTAAVLNGVGAWDHVQRIPEGPGWVLLATFQLALAVWMAVLARGAYRRLAERRAARRMNVRIHRRGEILRCELMHVGMVEELDTWAVVAPVLLEGDQITADMVPARTQLWWTVSDG
jgi:hypothetical protein